MLTPEELDRVCVTLIGSRNPLNIGAAARAMSNFGFLRLRVVHPWDPAFREARSAVDAQTVLTQAQVFSHLPEAIADCSLVVGTTGGAQRAPDEPLFRLEAAAEAIRAQLRSGARVALLFGSEKTGLSRHDLSRCNLLLRIPTRTRHPSMNLGQAVAVILYELIRESPGSHPAPSQPLPTAADRERLTALLLETLGSGGFAHRATPEYLERRLRPLVRRMALTQPDLHEWLGLFRQLLWKLRHPNSPPPAD